MLSTFRKTSVENAKQLEFVIFCIENLAATLHKDGETVYAALKNQGNIIDNYIVPEYDILHTQSKNYIINDILDVMKEKGVKI